MRPQRKTHAWSNCTFCPISTATLVSPPPRAIHIHNIHISSAKAVKTIRPGPTNINAMDNLPSAMILHIAMINPPIPSTGTTIPNTKHTLIRVLYHKLMVFRNPSNGHEP
ncbi:hypothetical protein EC968_008036 [Mortierella alpina]|nr:hypothetical protein EC968_008036 [Mortierella alpina]